VGDTEALRGLHRGHGVCAQSEQNWFHPGWNRGPFACCGGGPHAAHTAHTRVTRTETFLSVRVTPRHPPPPPPAHTR
jgi:hypothetical protein